MWLADNLITDDSHYAHHYKLRDEHGCLLTQHGGIWLLELNKFNAKHIESEEQRWLQFFKTGEQLNDDALPDWMTTEEMKQAMNTLSRFSEKEREYFKYQARQDYLREQRTIQKEHEQTAQQLEQTAKELQDSKLREEAAQKRERVALQEKAAALAELERLKAQLANKGQ